MTDTSKEAFVTVSQHLIVAGSNHDITWYRVTDKETIQVSSLTGAHMSHVNMKGDIVMVTLWFTSWNITGGTIDAISLYTSIQGDTVLPLINGYILGQLNISFSRNQLDFVICCNLSDDMSFMEAILGIQHSNTFYKLTYRSPLLLAVTGDYSTLGMYNANNVY